MTDTDRNPLAIVEVGSHFTADELAAWACPDPSRPGENSSSDISAACTMPKEVQKLVLLAAADISGDRSRVRSAAAADRP